MAKKKILIVDDEESVTKMVKISLEKAGDFEVKTENKGTNTLTAARQFKPDLILLDVMMPDLDGGEVAGQIKSDEGLKDTPIVFLTAAVTKDEIITQSNTIGGHPFIAKPVTIEELINSINKYIK